MLGLKLNHVSKRGHSWIVEDSVVLVIEPQISMNLKSVSVGLTMYFGEGWMPQ